MMMNVASTAVLWSSTLYCVSCSAFVLQSPIPSLTSKRQRHQQQQQLERSPPYATTNGNDDTNRYDEECDVLVLGSGPAARSIATLLSSESKSTSASAPLDVILADKNYDKPWPPNYGTWTDEWNAILDKYRTEFRRSGLTFDATVDREWKVTDTYFGGSFDIPTEERLRVDRPYVRIDKFGLRDALSPPKDDSGTGTSDEEWYRVLKASHTSQAISPNIYSPADTLTHDEDGSTIKLQSNDDDSSITVRTKLIVDCTGHETKLVLKENNSNLKPGFQIAYGILCTVAESDPASPQIGPYDKEAMTLFDYRTDHFETDPSWEKRAIDNPTFMYAMPLSENKIFFEETSLVARPALSFQECKDRCFRRLEHLGIDVLNVEEEEFCYIPMGGALPAPGQRVVGYGGSTAMVHPSTGFSLARVMMGACDVATCVKEGLSGKEVDLDRVAMEAYAATWLPDDIAQRNFAVFGGEFLMTRDVVGLRGFFDGFFRLEVEKWGGFLAGRPGLPYHEEHATWNARLVFGLTFLTKLPPSVGFDMFLAIVMYSLKEGVALPQSVVPLFGKPEGYVYEERPKVQGDVAAKVEAIKMIEESKAENNPKVEEFPYLMDGEKGSGSGSGISNGEKLGIVQKDEEEETMAV